MHLEHQTLILYVTTCTHSNRFMSLQDVLSFKRHWFSCGGSSQVTALTYWGHDESVLKFGSKTEKSIFLCTRRRINNLTSLTKRKSTNWCKYSLGDKDVYRLSKCDVDPSKRVGLSLFPEVDRAELVSHASERSLASEFWALQSMPCCLSVLQCMRRVKMPSVWPSAARLETVLHYSSAVDPWSETGPNEDVCIDCQQFNPLIKRRALWRLEGLREGREPRLFIYPYHCWNVQPCPVK